MEDISLYAGNGDLSIIHPDFSPLVPKLTEVFEQIWTPDDVQQLRKNFDRSRSSFPFVPNDGYRVSERMIQLSDSSQINIRIYTPIGGSARDGEDKPVLFVAHGGGWVVGGHESEGAMSRLICVRNQAVVISVDYRRAPEYPFPIPLNDVYDAYRWMLAHAMDLGIDTNRVILAGTSAGGSLVAGLSLRLREEEGGLKGIVGQLLNLPALCHPRYFPHAKHKLESYRQNAKAPTTNSSHMYWYWDQYYPDPQPNMLASPLLADHFHRLPPALIQVAGMDPLRDEGLAYAAELQNAGVPVDLHVYSGLPHGFVFAQDKEFTKEYFYRMIDWVEARTVPKR
ncbi:hypothetical protein N7454_007541 [Penicillium verhagenii]|nr:hypothetical protein N7454_007541 [Penicillium verhagenii]